MGNAKVRESNIELLRNISMFMILVIHANFVSLPKIEFAEMTSNIIPSVTRFSIESLGIVAVNVFVFISGWFGIRSRLKSVLSFIYQILFFLLGGGILFVLLGRASFSVSWLLDVFQLSGKDWFIKSYLLLMIIAPILNTYCNTAQEKTQRYVMFSFLLFEAVFGWAAGGSRFFVSGYGPLHFIGLYITAQYIHNQLQTPTTPRFIKRLFTMKPWIDFAIFVFCAIVNTSIIFGASFFTKNVSTFHSLCYSYNNPLVFLGALSLLLCFSKIKMPYVRVVNWLGASSFAVYLFHGETTVRNSFFSPQIQYLYEHYSGVGCICMIFLFLILVFALSVLIDQIRIITWNSLAKHTGNDN